MSNRKLFSVSCRVGSGIPLETRWVGADVCTRVNGRALGWSDCVDRQAAGSDVGPTVGKMPCRVFDIAAVRIGRDDNILQCDAGRTVKRLV